MRLWQDGLIAFFTAIALASIFWMIVRAVLLVPVRRQRSVVLICARDDATDLEDQVRTLLLLRSRQYAVDDVLLVDCGLTEEGKKICRLLADENRRVSLCGKNEIETYIT